MNIWVRRILYFLVLVGLIGEAFVAARLGKRRSEVEDALRIAIADTEKAEAAFAKAKMDYNVSRSKLQGVKTGWGIEWNLPAGGQIQNVGGRLSVRGVGSGNGLELRTVNDGANSVNVPPVVHVFVDNGQGGSNYIGEFVVPDSGSLTPDSCVLQPTWLPTPEDLQSWNFAGAVRLRSQIPPSGREAVENLNGTISRTIEKYIATDIRYTEQEKLKAGADSDLARRKSELLGDPQGQDIPEHPEYKVGLVQALQDIEEERNAIQLAVDELRRQIKAAVESRNSEVDSLKQLAGKTQSATKVSQRADKSR